jgi:hypothetical protein
MTMMIQIVAVIMKAAAADVTVVTQEIPEVLLHVTIAATILKMMILITEAQEAAAMIIGSLLFFL